MSEDKSPIFTKEGFSTKRKKLIKSTQQLIQEHGAAAAELNSIPSFSGLAQTSVPDIRPAYNAGEAEKVIKNEVGDSYVVFGNDRPAGLLSGYGAIGAQKSNTIDMVVGRAAASRRGKGPSDGTVIDNNFGTDAARIYISQLTDVDLNFGLSEGKLRSAKGRSAIGIKADGVRIIGREGIKIVTGGSHEFEGFGSRGETNSRGGKIQRAPIIELNAGNQKKKALQGVARGDHLKDCIIELGDILEELIGGMMKSHSSLAAIFGALGAIGIDAAGDVADDLLDVLGDSLYELKIKKSFWQVNYTEAGGGKFLVSKNVFSTQGTE